MPKLFRAAVAVLVSASVFSCGGSTEPKSVLTTLTISIATPTILVGQSAFAHVSAADQHGAQMEPGPVTWSTTSSLVATVNNSGVVTGLAIGQTEVVARAGGKEARTQLTVAPPPVARVSLNPPSANLGVGETRQFTATTFDDNSNVLSDRVIAWSSSDPTTATVTSNGLVTAVAIGVTTITATSEGKTGTAAVTVGTQTSCNSANAVQMNVGETRTLSAEEKSALCLGGSASGSEYVLIPFNNENVAASTLALRFSSLNTAAIQPGAVATISVDRTVVAAARQMKARDLGEASFRSRELADLRNAYRGSRRTSLKARALPPSLLTGIPTDPTVGSVVDINANLSGNLCSATKQLHGALVVAVLPHTIVLADTLAPAGGYTTAELLSFAQAFDTLGYDLDVSNFGAPSDMDGNNRVAILFTPGVNAIPGPPGGYIGGLTAVRDLFPANVCPSSNEGEMFYVPVPDPNKTINANYSDKSVLARGLLGTLVHEFQHLINAGRRIYVNNAGPEEIWLNEGLSHIAEELLYYKVSGNSPRTNITVDVFRSSQAQLDAANGYALGDMSRLSIYMASPESNSPFSQSDSFEMRGSIWQLLRYAADRKGGDESATWNALANTTRVGQGNFNAVFGDIIATTRDWAVAQFMDDAGLGEPPSYSHPSWNYRSVLPPINNGKFPLLTRPLVAGTPLDLSLAGGGAAYVRFSVGANTPATIYAAASGQPVPATIDIILVRTR